MANKYLMNIRGATASGKTSALKQFCHKRGFRVEKVSTGFSHLPVSVLDGGDIVVLGDYSANGNCLGPDRFHGGKADIMDCIMAVADKYSPELIIYEHMLTSLVFKGSYEIAQVAMGIGYNFFAVQLELDERIRLSRLRKRSGKGAGTKTFSRNNTTRVSIASDKLQANGIDVIRINVDGMRPDEMWKVVEYGIRKKVERVC